ncbi:transglycosylase SLT domain-containing protein [Marinibaculum pumilum]|uniref:Transglycosylase SLT domain-containing protein n=1 Tax=Marinibaculum pumilum TaxID=1766165 RepID=A0ABV7L6Z3_9PROT
MSATSFAPTVDLMRAQAAGAPRDIAQAIGNASRRTGVDFAYLVAQARQESSFRPAVEAATSSATGLYQFIDQTWLGTVKAHGAKHGLGAYAGLIRTDASGRHSIADPADRQAVLDLRKDPEIASLMAAEHARENGLALEQALNRPANATDLYMAHFLGVEGAKDFLQARDADPGRAAADLFPRAARANRGVFYDAGGQPRSLEQVYDRFAAKFDDLVGPDGGGQAIAGRFGQIDAAQAGPVALDRGGYAMAGRDGMEGNSILTRARLGGSGVAPLVPSLRPESFLALAALQEVAVDMGAAPARADSRGADSRGIDSRGAGSAFRAA